MADKLDKELEGWDEVGGGGNSTAWDYKTNPSIEGIYKGMKTNIGPNKSNMYNVTTKDGEMGIWGTALLDDRFSQIPVGNEVKIKYLGKQTNPKTARSYHNFQIFTRPVNK